MASKPYAIEEVLPEWALRPEDMGSKEKFWYRRPDRLHNRLFKYPHPGTGEHWAEKIAAEVAKLIGIPCARVTLAVCDGVRGSSSWSFVGHKQELFHGNQLLADALASYDPTQKFRQFSHTLENIFRAIEQTFVGEEVHHNARGHIAGYLVFDALIGNTDRHHENWGLLLSSSKDGWGGSIAPSFDHATSLGRELIDNGDGKCRQSILDEDRIGAYSEKARGAVYLSSDIRHAPSPLALVRQATQSYPKIFLNALNKLSNLQPAALNVCVERVPDDWMSPLAKRFAVALMCYNLIELRRLML